MDVSDSVMSQEKGLHNCIECVLEMYQVNQLMGESQQTPPYEMNIEIFFLLVDMHPLYG